PASPLRPSPSRRFSVLSFLPEVSMRPTSSLLAVLSLLCLGTAGCGKTNPTPIEGSGNTRTEVRSVSALDAGTVPDGRTAKAASSDASVASVVAVTVAKGGALYYDQEPIDE